MYLVSKAYMTFESFFFFKKYDCNKRYIKTLEHLQIYFDRLCELSYKTGLIILSSHSSLCIFLHWNYSGLSTSRLFFVLMLDFMAFLPNMCQRNFTSLFFPFIYFYPLLYLYLKGIPVIYLGPFVILQNSNFFDLF